MSTRCLPMVYFVGSSPFARRNEAFEYRLRESAVFPSLEEWQALQPAALIVRAERGEQERLVEYARRRSVGLAPPAVVIADQPAVDTVVSTMKAGVVEFLQSPVSHEDFAESVLQALQASQHWRRCEAEYLRLDEQLGRLTSRERETLSLVVAGVSNKAMAAKLLISERAVEMRRSKIMKKLNVRGTAELLDRAITHRVLAQCRDCSALEAPGG